MKKSTISEDKIKDIVSYLENLESKVPKTLEEYLNSRDTQLICERLFEIITEAAIDLVFIFINEKKFDMPEDDENALDLLVEKKIISAELAKRLREVRRMRNIIAHKYGKINPELVYYAIHEELSKDINELIDDITSPLGKKYE